MRIAEGWEREFYLELGRNISGARRSAGLSIKQLGELVQVQKTTLCRYENGKGFIGVNRLQDIADKLGITSTSLLPKL